MKALLAVVVLGGICSATEDSLPKYTVETFYREEFEILAAKVQSNVESFREACSKDGIYSFTGASRLQNRAVFATTLGLLGSLGYGWSGSDLSKSGNIVRKDLFAKDNFCADDWMSLFAITWYEIGVADDKEASTDLLKALARSKELIQDSLARKDIDSVGLQV